jgi:TPR repeat protein
MILFTLSFSNDYDNAIELTKRGEYQSALEILKRLADNGNADAQYRVGQMYNFGYGTKVDTEKAKYYYQLVIDKYDFPDAYINLAFIYLENDRNTNKALELLYKIENTYPAAQHSIGKIFNNGINIKPNLSESFKWYLKAANNNFAYSQYMLGVFYENGLGGITRDIKKAKEWYSKASNNGNKESKEILQNEEKHFDYSNKLFDNKLHDDIVKSYFYNYQEKEVTDFKIASKEHDSKFKETVCYITYINSENVKMYGKITLAKNESNNAWIALNFKSSSVKSDLKQFADLFIIINN